MAVIGIGIVGCGGNGLNHAEVWHSMDEAKVVAVCDVVPEIAEERARLLGVKAFSRVEDLVKEQGVDAVDVVNSASHRDPAVIAAKAGKHVLVEVAFANSVQEADDMISAAEKSGVNMMYAQTQRFYAPNAKGKELIDAGEVGDPISLEYSFNRGARPEREFAPNEQWHRWRSTGGGFFMYEGTHFTDQIKWLMGSEIDTVYTIGMGRFVSGGDGEDNGIAGFKHQGGGFATLWRGVSYPGVAYQGWRLVGTRGMLDVAYPNQVRLGNDGEWRDVPFPFKDAPPVKTPTRERDAVNFHGFQAEFKEFIASINEGRPPSCTAYDGRASTAAALAVIESHETGQPVQLAPD